MAGSEYYDRKLAGKRLEHCYRIASPRVEQYLDSEIGHVLDRIRPTDAVLELGCGYGRVTTRLAEVGGRTVGIDSAPENIAHARSFDKDGSCDFMVMDALSLTFPDDTFDVVVCVQNGICAFNVDQKALVHEALRVTRKGGIVLFSSYSDRFWPQRLTWFEAQSAEGLIGPIDYTASKDGFIVCTDGFHSGRMTAEDFRALCSVFSVEFMVEEVDESAVFCEIVK